MLQPYLPAQLLALLLKQLQGSLQDDSGTVTAVCDPLFGLALHVLGSLLMLGFFDCFAFDLSEVLKHEKVWRSTLGGHSTGIHLSSPVTSHRRSWFVDDPTLSLFQTLSVGIVDIGMLTSVRLQQTPSLLWQVLQMTKDAKSHKPPATKQANAFIPVSLWKAVKIIKNPFYIFCRLQTFHPHSPIESQPQWQHLFHGPLPPPCRQRDIQGKRKSWDFAMEHLQSSCVSNVTYLLLRSHDDMFWHFLTTQCCSLTCRRSCWRCCWSFCRSWLSILDGWWFIRPKEILVIYVLKTIEA